MKRDISSETKQLLCIDLRLLTGLLLSAVLGISTAPISAATPRAPHSGTRAVRDADTSRQGGTASAAATDQTKGTFWIIPHTHWEGAVFKTREEYLESDLPNIMKALSLLKTHSDYRFVLDQVAYVKPFLERYPEEAPAFRKFVSEGRLQIVGGNDVMLDVNIPSGESWIRQALYGKGYYREKLGADVTVGWGLDTFGHHAQMPQLLKLAGYNSYWFQRGPRSNDVPTEFLWQGIDGTRIPAFWLALGYGLFYPAPKSLAEFESYARETWDSLGHYSRWPDRVALAGADVSEPEDALPAMIHEFNRDAAQPFTLRFGLPTDFEAVVAKRADRQRVTGELNPVFQGTYSNRIEVKQWMREDERALTTAEKLGSLAAWLGVPKNDENLARAWEPVLFNQAHDLTSGTMVDKVYLDTIRGYEFSKSLADEMVESEIDTIASKIDTRASQTGQASAIPVLVFNTLGWPRTDIAEVRVGFSDSDVNSLALVDFSGKDVPNQLVKTERYSTGGIKDTRIAFVAHDVPPLGYSLYQIVPRRGSKSIRGGSSGSGESSKTTMHYDTGSIENEYYRAAFDLWTGEMTSLLVKSGSSGWEALAGHSANVVTREQDGGDFWELYGTLNGGRLTAMTRKQGLPPSPTSHFSNEYVGGNGVTRQGPVFSEFHVSHPFGEGSFATTVRLYPGIRRIDIKTQILNNDKFVRYRVLFPTSIKSGRRLDEIPFGAIERPTEQEFPAQNWTDWNDGSAKGMALINRGLPGNNVADGTLILSLMRSARITAYPFFGGYEPGVSSDLGLELGVERTFDYALMPYTGDYRQWEVCRAGLEFNNPLIVRTVPSHAAALPGRWGSLEVSAPNVVISALKPGQGGAVVLRVYEAGNQRTEGVRIKLQPGVASASEVNLIEDSIHKLELRENTLLFDLAPYQIKTFKLELSQPAHEK
jgi:alpha-mannosidase